MSVEDVVAGLRRAYALLDVAARRTAAADDAIEDGARIFASVTRGSIWPQVAEGNRLVARAADDVRLAAAGIIQAQDLIDDFCRRLSGVGAGESPGMDEEPVAAEQGHEDETTQSLVAELLDGGAPVRPENVVRVLRLPNGRIVWMESGSANGSLDHIMSAARVADFARLGITREKIVDLVVAALTRGRQVGYIGTDRPVYEVTIDGDLRRVAISVAINGLIVGAMPVPLRKKLRLYLYRDRLR